MKSLLHCFSLFKKGLAAIFLLCFISGIKAQDPHFTQYWNNLVYYNPGYIGLNPGTRVRLNYRDQWIGLPTSFRTYSFSADVAERSLPGSGGIGVLAVQDQAGTSMIKATNIGIGLSTRVPLQENMVTQFGMMISYVEKSINWDNLVFTDQLHAIYGNILPTSFVPPTKNKVSYPDFSVGGVYRFNEPSYKFSSIQGTIGVAYHHVFRPNESFLGLKSPLPSRLSITGDLVMEVDAGGKSVRNSKSKGAFKFDPGFIYEKQAEFSTISLGLNILKSNIYAGIWYRNQKFEFFKATDLMFSIGVNAPFSQENRAKLMYTYDFIVTELRTAARATHEVSLVIEMDEFSLFKEKRRGPRNYRNPRSSEIDYTPF